jgi:hypothetical protein
MSMPVFIGAWAEYLLVARWGKRWIVQFVSRVEMFLPGYVDHGMSESTNIGNCGIRTDMILSTLNLL